MSLLRVLLLLFCALGCVPRTPSPTLVEAAVVDTPEPEPERESELARESEPEREREPESEPEPEPEYPDYALIDVDEGAIQLREQIVFEIDTAKLRPQNEALLAEIADAILRTPRQRVSIEVHTDSVGKADHNLELSQRRAEAVLERLVALGVERSRLEAIGRGEEEPICDEFEDSRARQRRVELWFVTPSRADDQVP